jgi:hypothetical protein
VAAALDGLVFTPTPDEVAPGNTVTTTVTAALEDSAGETAAATSTITATQVTPPSTTDTIVLNISEQYVTDNSIFTIKVNGQQVGGEYQAHALHSTGDSETVSLTGDWGSGVNDVEISFINDTDRHNLYVSSISENGVTYAETSAALRQAGSATFAVGGTTPTAAAPVDTLTLQLSDIAPDRNALFVLYIDGKQVTTPQVVTALHDANETQGFTFTGDLGSGTHTIGVACVNHASGPSADEEPSLYVDGITLNGSDVSSGSTAPITHTIAYFTITASH